MAVERKDIALAAGQGLTLAKFTIPYNNADLAATAGTSKKVTLFNLPQAAIIVAVRLKHTVAFAGTGITDVDVTVGTAGDTDVFCPGLDIDSAVADTTLTQAGVATAATFGHAAVDVVAEFVSAGGNLNVLTAGSVDIYVLYANVTTPSA